MKYFSSLLVIFISLPFISHASDFITKWDLSISGSGPTQISFKAATAGNVGYTWETIPVGTSGAGTFTGPTATITGLPAGSIIQLKINDVNFDRIIMSASADADRLMDVQQWGTVSWKSMDSAFANCSNLNITASDLPDLSLVTSMRFMFSYCSNLNGPANIDNWDVSTVQSMSYMFANAWIFNQPIGNWDVGNVVYMNSMFTSANSFNQSLGNWNTSSLVSALYLFANASDFNQPIGNWNTSSLTTTYNMFLNAVSFNQPLGNWNTGNVTTMESMFCNATNFNQPIGNWNTSNTTNMSFMFFGASNFNQNIGNWDVSSVTNMSNLFFQATSFNQNLGNWNTSGVTNMGSMFNNASSFNQNIGNWNISSVQTAIAMLNSCGMDCANYSSTLNGWAANPSVPSTVTLGSLLRHYGTNAVSGRDYLINTKTWTITGDIADNLVCGAIPTSIDQTKELISCSSFYPNPTYNFSNLNIYSVQDKKASVMITNTLGNVVFQEEIILNTGKTTYTVDVTHFVPGIYALTINQCNVNTAKQLLVVQ